MASIKTISKPSLYFIFTLALLACSAKKEVSTFVYDQEELLTKEQKNVLDQLYRAHEKKTSNEIALLTTSSFEPDSNILFYSVNMANKLGIGKKEKDNGVLIVVSKKNKAIRIATGHGTEKVLEDHVAKKIIDSLMIPAFKRGAYYEGIYAGSAAIVSFLEQPGHEIKEK